MAYAIINDYIEKSKYPLKAKYEMMPKYLTIHNTANDASAVAEIAYMQRNSNQTSFHVAIDDKHAIVGIPFDRIAWHCGDGSSATSGNRTSIGIEICYSKSGGAKYNQAEANAIEYTAQLLKKYGWGIDRVRFHKEWSGKNCPHRILDEGRGASFKLAIMKRLNELNAVKTASIENKKEEIRMFEPTTGTLKNEMALLLEEAFKEGLLSSIDHAKKARTGKLTLDDAIGLQATILRRKLASAKK
jgi:N-acetylmuramoyl-L-alanine amidase